MIPCCGRWRRGLYVAGLLASLGLWVSCGQPEDAPQKREPSRLATFVPDSVQRVRVWVAKRWLDRTRTAVGWRQTPGRTDDGSPFPMDALLGRLADLRGMRVSGDRRRVRAVGPGKAAVRVRLWLGRRRTLGIALYRDGERVLATSSARKGVFRVPGGLLRWIEQAVGRGTDRPAAIPFRRGSLGRIVLRVGGREHVLRKRASGWVLGAQEGSVAADPDRLEALLRALSELQVLERLGKGPAAAGRYPLGTDPTQITVDDGKVVTVSLGGACPTRPSGRIAHRKPDGAVLCVTPLASGVLRGSFRETRLFSAAPDGVREVVLVRGGRRVAIRRHRDSDRWERVPGAGGAGPVDQEAAERWVTTLSLLRVALEGTAGPPTVQPAGEVRLRSADGRAERVELGAASGRAGLWARKSVAEPWRPLPEEVLWALDGSGLGLRSLRLCAAQPQRVTGVYRSGFAGLTEWVYRDRGDWQVLLLQGAPSPKRVAEIGRTLDAYRALGGARRGGVPRHGWKRPVVALLPVDRARRTTVAHRVATLRALRPVASEPAPAHGLGRAARRIHVRYWTRCQRGRGARRCEEAACAFRLGASASRGGGCFVQRLGHREVLLLARPDCDALASPMVSRRVTRLPLAELEAVTLQWGRKRVRLERAADQQWRRAGRRHKKSPPDPRLGPALLGLAPLTAVAVQGYGSGVPRGRDRVVLRARFERARILTFSVTFYGPPDAKGRFLAMRSGRPVRYLVRGEPVQRLRKLLSAD